MWNSRPRQLRTAAVAVALVLGSLVAATGQQLTYSTGQTVAPAFEGWEKNPDGSFNMVFGYFNRNLDEHIQVPVGPENSLEPGGPDRGQPIYFFPRRNRLKVTFDPPQFKIYPDYRLDSNSPWSPLWQPPPAPSDGQWPVTMTFSVPGTYVVRVMAHDGGLASTEDLNVTVTQ